GLGARRGWRTSAATPEPLAARERPTAAIGQPPPEAGRPRVARAGGPGRSGHRHSQPPAAAGRGRPGPGAGGRARGPPHADHGRPVGALKALGSADARRLAPALPYSAGCELTRTR